MSTVSVAAAPTPATDGAQVSPDRERGRLCRASPNCRRLQRDSISRIREPLVSLLVMTATQNFRKGHQGN